MKKGRGKSSGRRSIPSWVQPGCRVCCCPCCLLAALYRDGVFQGLRSNTAFAEGSCPDHSHGMVCSLAGQLPDSAGAPWGMGSWEHGQPALCEDEDGPISICSQREMVQHLLAQLPECFLVHQDFPAAVARLHRAGPFESPVSSALQLQF